MQEIPAFDSWEVKANGSFCNGRIAKFDPKLPLLVRGRHCVVMSGGHIEALNLEERKRSLFLKCTAWMLKWPKLAAAQTPCVLQVPTKSKVAVNPSPSQCAKMHH